MAVGDAYVFPGFFTLVLTQLFFSKPPTTFLTCFCRGEGRKYARGRQCNSLNLYFNPFQNKPWFLHVCSVSFPTLFSTPWEKFLPFSSNLKLSSANSLNLEESKIRRLGKGLYTTTLCMYSLCPIPDMIETLRKRRC